MDYLEPEQIESRFEAAGMPEYYQTICGAVRESAGQTAIWAGDYIEPLFHAVSAGGRAKGMRRIRIWRRLRQRRMRALVAT